jgi:thymidylate synthase
MRVIHGESFPYVYARVIEEVLNAPDQVRSPRGRRCKEITPCVMAFPVGWYEDGLFESPVRSTDRKYLAGELMWYYHGLNDLECISRYSKFWAGIANDDGTLNSAYGWQLFRKTNDHGITEWQWAIESLQKDPDTRQAVMVLHAPRMHRFGNKDVPCTLNVTFTRRDEYLDMVVTMRSNDLWFGVPYDVPFFISLLRNACLLLDLTPGNYTHIALNMHAYEKDWKSLAQMVEDGITSPEDMLPRQSLPWVNSSGNMTKGLALGTDELAAHLKEVSQWR